MVEIDKDGQVEGFLDLDHTAHLDLLTQNVETAKLEIERRLRRLRHEPHSVEVVALPNGRSEVKVTYRSGVPSDLFTVATTILEDIEKEFGG